MAFSNLANTTPASTVLISSCLNIMKARLQNAIDYTDSEDKFFLFLKRWRIDFRGQLVFSEFLLGLSATFTSPLLLKRVKEKRPRFVCEQ
ncbi:hypothetical protein AMELA_G00064230 [Ameiurus melas]|uniref:Uncharacterized protein n=1 Tax=Ameiurus melas TaxID=219545 RepID=A0A7J6B592_AMEME|nr:hypothetical protein AMELA_G00064230 [Ameiurus melas]